MTQLILDCSVVEEQECDLLQKKKKKTCHFLHAKSLCINLSKCFCICNFLIYNDKQSKEINKNARIYTKCNLKRQLFTQTIANTKS